MKDIARTIIAIPLSVYLVGCTVTNHDKTDSRPPVNVNELKLGRYMDGDDYCDILQSRLVGCARFSESYTNDPLDDPSRYYKTMADGEKLWYFEIDVRRHEGILADLASTPEELKSKAEAENWHKATTNHVLRPENFRANIR